LDDIAGGRALGRRCHHPPLSVARPPGRAVL